MQMQREKIIRRRKHKEGRSRDTQKSEALVAGVMIGVGNAFEHRRSCSVVMVVAVVGKGAPRLHSINTDRTGKGRERNTRGGMAEKEKRALKNDGEI